MIHDEIKGEGDITLDDPEEVEYKLMYDRCEKNINNNNNDTLENKQILLDKLYELDRKNHQLFLKIMSINSWHSNIKNSYSVINDIFSGQSLTTYTCNECKKSNYKFERFDILTLHLPENMNLNIREYKIETLLENYISSEELKGENQYRCMFCSTKTDAIKSNIIYHLPSTMVLMIKKYQNYMGRIIKSNAKINYNHILDISPYIYDNNIGTNTYELYAIITHSGSTCGGHYYTYAKNPINNLWYLYDDSDVYYVDDDEPLECNGYVLFYRRKE